MSDLTQELMKDAGGSRGEAAFVVVNYNKDGVPVEMVGLPNFAREYVDTMRTRAERLEAALKGLVEHCELTRDTAGFWRPRQVHQLSPTQWQSWCKQIKSARNALKGADHE